MYFSESALLEVAGTTQTVNEDEKGQTWYDQFLEDYDYESPKRGQVLEGIILRIDEDALVVDVGMKRDAIVPNRDLNNLQDEVLENLSVGDEILVYVLRPPVGDDDLLVSLNKGIEYENWEQAEKYLEDGTTLDLEVVGHNRGGLLVNFESLRGFLPYSQVPELRRTRDPKRAEEIKRDMIGETLPVKIIEVNRKRRRLIFSARAAQEERRKQRLEELEEGQIIHGPVVNIVKFGIFVDLDGVDGLVHISKLDWHRIDHPSDLFKVGDEIDVKVIDVDVERERVSLDRKSLLPSPWDTFEEQHHPGETIEGQVTNVLDFGAFVEVAAGVEGLVHVSEIGYTASGSPQDVVKKGEKVLVRILDIDTERERISLSMRQVPLERQIAWSLENADYGSTSEETETTASAEAPSSEESPAPTEAVAEETEAQPVSEQPAPVEAAAGETETQTVSEQPATEEAVTEETETVSEQPIPVEAAVEETEAQPVSEQPAPVEAAAGETETQTVSEQPATEEAVTEEAETVSEQPIPVEAAVEETETQTVSEQSASVEATAEETEPASEQPAPAEAVVEDTEVQEASEQPTAEKTTEETGTEPETQAESPAQESDQIATAESEAETAAGDETSQGDTPESESESAVIS